MWSKADNIVITQCSISELYANGDQDPIALAKLCERRRCGHIPDALSSHDCLTSCINISGENKHRYILATQDEQLRGEMRRIPGVPMIYIRRAVMIMEPPSPASLDRKDALERQKLGGIEGSGKRKRGNDENEKVKKKKKGPKEPNPLSIKKKKKSEETAIEAKEIIIEGGKESKVIQADSNVIGDVTEETRRHKRRRKHHKKPANPEQETIPIETES
jgi:U3 small nucleolar RNA-associated protein 23